MEEKKSAWQRYKENLGDTRPWDLVNPNTEWLSEEKAEKRYSICKSCPELISLTSQCKKCGCFMAAKTKLAHASCPLGKWGKEEVSQDII
jgi:hypothetical protein